MKVLIAGDYSPLDRVAQKIEKGDTIDLFSSVSDVIIAADYSIVNFESVVLDKKAAPIDKCGPHLKCSPKTLPVLKKAGFRCLTLANNHFRDFADEGVLTSIEFFKENGFDYVGGGADIDAAEAILYKTLNNEILAVINVCENEFSIASKTRAGSAPLDAVKVFHRVCEARSKAAYILVIVHGGHEHYQLPSPRMKELYRFFIEVGADAVVNHHQHCYSGYEFYQGKPIVYGLGNFFFDHPKKRKSIWNEGYMAEIDFTPSGIIFATIPYVQCDNEPRVRLMVDDEKKRFENNISALNEVIADDQKLQQELDKFIVSRRSSIMSVFTRYTNRYLRGAVGRHWIPYLLPKSKVLDMIDYISCESQRDVTLGYLEEYTKLK